ncbi:MAG: hypothetical protein LQ349_008868 [Xanthoria aureola]|nr:MAG: hypothetical protein LQ349_008868 [Xanthoria aureola]
MVRLGRRTRLPPQHMTPIKIRGKRGQKARLRAQQESREEIEELNMTSSEATLAPELPFSKLESLPTEIIESIFLYSKNLELPRASLALGRTLSSTGFKHLVLRAILVDPYLDSSNDETFETGHLQSALLRCRWVDDAMFSYALHQARLAKLTAFFSSKGNVKGAAPHNALLGPGCPVADTSTSTIAQFVESMKSQSAPLDQRRWEWVSYAGKRYTLLFPDYPGRVWFRHHGDPDQEHLIYSDTICGFELRYPCEIPTKVLHGPWSQTKLNFLRSLFNAGATLDWETSNNGEVAETSLREAIVQGDTSFLHLMLRKPEIAPSDSMEEIDSWPSSPAIPITQEHLRLAIFDGGCNTRIVNMLLGRGVSHGLRLDDDDNLNWSLRLDDNEMLDWATAKSEEGDERGKWLLQTIGDWETDRKKGHRISDDAL